MLWGVVTFAGLRLMTTVLYLFRQYGSDYGFNGGLARSQLAYAAPFSLYVLVEVVQMNLHQYAVAYRYDAAAFARAAVGCLSIPLVEFMASSACNVMMVRMREHLLDDDGRAVLAIAGYDPKADMVFAPLVGCLMVVAHMLIITLFTARYEASVPVFMVWTLMFLLAALQVDGVLRVYSQVSYLMKLGIFKVILMAAAINWFMSVFGLVGAVLVVILTTMTAKLLALARIRSVMHCSVRSFLPWRDLLAIIVAAAVAALPALVVESALEVPALVAMAIIGLVYMLSYLGLLVLLNVPSRDEKQMVLGWLRRRGGMPVEPTRDLGR